MKNLFDLANAIHELHAEVGADVRGPFSIDPATDSIRFTVHEFSVHKILITVHDDGTFTETVDDEISQHHRSFSSYEMNIREAFDL